MKHAIIGLVLICCATGSAMAQKFAFADVRISTQSPNSIVRLGLVRSGRYEFKNATMLDLIHTAYGFDLDKIVGGPSWLEMTRYDIAAKLSTATSSETNKQMLQSLLADRFQLVVRNETQLLPAYALLPGPKKHQLKAAASGKETGCKLVNQSEPVEGAMRVAMYGADGALIPITLGAGGTLQYNCRNMTMAAFAAGFRSMFGMTSLGNNPVLDHTGLEGSWDFDLKYSLGLPGPVQSDTGNRITIFEAVEKQLGLKLEVNQAPVPVIVVTRVNEKPSANPPGTAEALPPLPVPTEFEVASVKPMDPSARAQSAQMQPGGRFTAQGMPMFFLVMRGFNSSNSEQIAGMPGWASTERFDINAKAPSEGPESAPLDAETLAPLIRHLLVNRFNMKFHTEERPVNAYTLVAGKPKLKKADPASRTFCKTPTLPGAPPGSRILQCQNVTMAQFAERLLNMGPGLNWPVLDATGLEGAWDFTLTYGPGQRAGSAGGRGGDAPAPPKADALTAADPAGGYTLFEAIERQLGLKLEMQKRPMPVIVIDHLEQKPSEN